MSENKGSLADKVTVVVFSRILTALIDWSIIVIIVNLISETEFAILSTLLIVYEVAKNIATLGFPESIFYYFEKLSKSYRRAFAFQTTAMLFITATLAAIGIVAFKFFVPELLTEFKPESIKVIQDLLPYIAVIVVFEIPTWPVNNILLALGRQKEAGWYQILTSLLSFSAVVVPLLLGYSLSIVIFGLLSYSIIRFLGSFIWVSLVIPEGPLKTKHTSIRDQVNFSIPLGISSLVSQFNKSIDKIIVITFFGEILVANYNVGANEIPILRVIPFAVGSVLISRYVGFQLNSKFKDLIELWHKSIEKVAILIIPLVIISVVLAKEIIPILYETEGTDYARAVLPFQIYNLITLIRVAHYGSALQAFGDTKGILNLSISLLILNIIFSVPATYFFGITGTAAGTLAANIINWFFTLRKIGTHLDVPFYEVLPIKKYCKIVVLSLVIAIPVYFVKEMSVMTEFTPGTIFMYSATAYIAVYLLLGSVFKLITRSDWKNFLNAITLKFFWAKN